MSEQTEDDVFSTLKPIQDTKVGTAHGIAAIALSLAMKYHDINTIQDGTLYQQYKLEGKNLAPLHIDMVFETAIKIEQHLLASEERIAKYVVDAIVEGIEKEEAAEKAENPETHHDD